MSADGSSQATWGRWHGAALVIGAAVGSVVGVLVDQLATGLVLGAAIGLITGVLHSGLALAPARDRPRIAAMAGAIVLLGLVATVVVLIR
ncbi:hypothetical protein [Euzebya sp.]|uniref:hypothetical protein n=1 Tax=Euzebya sp. TaxID=1971409 RepID=UPI003519074F